MFRNGKYIPLHERAAMAARPPNQIVRPGILSEHRDEIIPHGLYDNPPDFVEITELCGCGFDINLLNNVTQKPGEERLYKCSNPNLTHFFIKTLIGSGRHKRDVYKYDNFYMETSDGLNIYKHIPIMSTIDFPHLNRKKCSNDSLQFFNKTTGVFQSLRRYIFSGYKVPELFRTYLKQLRKSVGRTISSELYVIGVQYRTYPFDIQLGITETYKLLEANPNARIRGKREELQIINERQNKNKYMSKIGKIDWYIRYINRGNYKSVLAKNSQINLRSNNPAKKIGLLIVGTKEELRPICENFSAENINSRDDAIARPIIIKLDHILKPGHLDKWFKPDDSTPNINQISRTIESLKLGANAKIAHRIEEIRNHSGSKSGTKSRSRSA